MGASTATLPIPAATVRAVRSSLESLVDRTIETVMVESPEYAGVLEGPEGLAIRLGIEQAMRGFLDAVERGTRLLSADSGEVWRRLGEAEFQAGRSLDALRSAFRAGTLAVWREAARVATEAHVEVPTVAALAEAIFVFADELASDVVAGYLRAQSDEAGEQERRRRRLISLLLDAEHHDPESIERAAALSRWPLPRRLAVLALAGEPAVGLLRHLPQDVLAGSDRDGGYVLVPDPDGPGRTALLTHALSGRTAALGPTVAPWHAARSLRLARQTLSLVERGALRPRSPARSSDHLAELILLSDDELVRELVASRLAPLDAVSAADRARLLETLGAWLDHQRHTPTIAAALHVHPQTVRYRLATLRELLGEVVDTPAGRFELGLALRAEALIAVPSTSAGG